MLWDSSIPLVNFSKLFLVGVALLRKGKFTEFRGGLPILLVGIELFSFLGLRSGTWSVLEKVACDFCNIYCSCWVNSRICRLYCHSYVIFFAILLRFLRRFIWSYVASLWVRGDLSYYKKMQRCMLLWTIKVYERQIQCTFPFVFTISF